MVAASLLTIGAASVLVMRERGSDEWWKAFYGIVKRDSAGNVVALSALADVPLTGDTLERLPELEHLSELDVFYAEIDDSAFHYICQSKSLKYLNVNASSVSEARMRDLRLLSNLRVLVLTTATEQVLASCSLPSLNKLSLKVKIKDIRGLKVGQLKRLRFLAMSGCEVDDDDLAHIARLKALRKLYLNANPITDEGIAHLYELSNLRELYIERTQVSQAGVAELRSQLPHCDVHAGAGRLRDSRQDGIIGDQQLQCDRHAAMCDGMLESRKESCHVFVR